MRAYEHVPTHDITTHDLCETAINEEASDIEEVRVVGRTNHTEEADYLQVVTNLEDPGYRRRNTGLEGNGDDRAAEHVKKPSLWSSFNYWRTKRTTVLGGGCFGAATVLVLNVYAAVYLHQHSVLDPGPGVPVNPRIFIGNCAKVTRLNAGLHLLINTLSTLLLACSNMFMQLLLAPTREEVDKWHRRQQWLDISIPSLRNLRFLSLRTRVLWFLLAFSSLPLHLIYNSVIYKSDPMNDITMHVVTTGFLAGTPATVQYGSAMYDWRRQQYMHGLERGNKKHRKLVYQKIDGDLAFNWNQGCNNQNNCSTVQRYAMDKKYTRTMTPIECLDAYSTFTGNRSHVMFVTTWDYFWNSSVTVARSALPNSTFVVSADAEKLPNPIRNSLRFSKELSSNIMLDFWMEYNWLCGNTNSFDCRQPATWRKDPSIIEHWNILGFKVDECLVTERSVDEKCSINFSLDLLIAVCCINFVKLVCMLYSTHFLASRKSQNKPLATVGDAIASFLSKKDLTTRHLALADRNTLEKDISLWSYRRAYMWTIKRRRWYQLVSNKRLGWTFGLSTVILTASIGAMSWSLDLTRARAGSMRRVMDIEFGAVDQSTFGQLSLTISPEQPESMKRGFLVVVFFANMWQLLFSLLYITINAMLTCLCVELEWQSFASHKKPLRVSAPVAKQRGTYFLSLPWRYALPLTAVFLILHWTLSQSVFLYVLSVYTSSGFKNEMIFLATSPRPLITTVGIGLLVLLSLLALCFRKTDIRLTQGGSCSAIISAACQGTPGDDDAALRAVQWGELSSIQVTSPDFRNEPSLSSHVTHLPNARGNLVEDTSSSAVRHCRFTSFDVVSPVPDVYYC